MRSKLDLKEMHGWIRIGCLHRNVQFIQLVNVDFFFSTYFKLIFYLHNIKRRYFSWILLERSKSKIWIKILRLRDWLFSPLWKRITLRAPLLPNTSPFFKQYCINKKGQNFLPDWWFSCKTLYFSYFFLSEIFTNW